jgi:hypothetical protein
MLVRMPSEKKLLDVNMQLEYFLSYSGIPTFPWSFTISNQNLVNAPIKKTFINTSRGVNFYVGRSLVVHY